MTWRSRVRISAPMSVSLSFNHFLLQFQENLIWWIPRLIRYTFGILRDLTIQPYEWINYKRLYFIYVGLVLTNILYHLYQPLYGDPYEKFLKKGLGSMTGITLYLAWVLLNIRLIVLSFISLKNGYTRLSWLNIGGVQLGHFISVIYHLAPSFFVQFLLTLLLTVILMVLIVVCAMKKQFVILKQKSIENS